MRHSGVITTIQYVVLVTLLYSNKNKKNEFDQVFFSRKLLSVKPFSKHNKAEKQLCQGSIAGSHFDCLFIISI